MAHLWNPKVLNAVRKNPPVDPVSRQVIPTRMRDYLVRESGNFLEELYSKSELIIMLRIRGSLFNFVYCF
jgi:hypothetical protein